MSKKIHMCLDIRGALMNWVDHEWHNVLINDDGKPLSARAGKAALLDELAKGHYKIPIGEPCEGFDYGEHGGCPGHPCPEEEEPRPAADNPTPTEPTGSHAVTAPTPALENLLVGTQVLTKSGEKAWVHRIMGQQIYLSFEGYPCSGRRFPSQTPYGIEDLALTQGATP